MGRGQRQEPKVDDSNTPPLIAVKTNKPGQGPNGEHTYLSGTDDIGHFKLGAGLKAQLFASEAEFPELVGAGANGFRHQGPAVGRRLAQLSALDRAKQPLADKLLIFEDTDADGKADKCKTFAGDLANPTGFEFWNGGVIVAQGPDICSSKTPTATTSTT